MTKPTTITLTIEISEVIDATIGPVEGGSEDDRDLAESLAVGIRALVLADKDAVFKAAKIYRLAQQDIQGPNMSTVQVERIMREAEIERLMDAYRDPDDLLN